jgi:nitrogen fixation/metabolism regulation signal transduction histidine kinase
MNSDSTAQGISKAYIWSLTLRCFYLFVAGIGLTGIIFLLSFQQTSGSSYSETFQLLSNIKQHIFLKTIIIYFTGFVFIVVGIVLISLLYSHRIAGPVHRLTEFTKQVSAGDFSNTVTLRENDSIKTLSAELNTLVLFYKDATNALQSSLEEIKKCAAHEGVEYSANLSRHTENAQHIIGQIRL